MVREIDSITIYFANNGAYLEYSDTGGDRGYRSHREVYPSVFDACTAIERLYDETKNED